MLTRGTKIVRRVDGHSNRRKQGGFLLSSRLTIGAQIIDAVPPDTRPAPPIFSFEPTGDAGTPDADLRAGISAPGVLT